MRKQRPVKQGGWGALQAGSEQRLSWATGALGGVLGGERLVLQLWVGSVGIDVDLQAGS